MSRATHATPFGVFALLLSIGPAYGQPSGVSTSTAGETLPGRPSELQVTPPAREAADGTGSTEPLPEVPREPAATPAPDSRPNREERDEGGDQNEGLEVITVTAQKRAQDIQEVPSSVTALTSETYQTYRAAGADIRALSARVPSLTIESSFGRTFPRMYIRGLGNADFDLNASQPVSLVLDNVVLENPIVKSYPMFDIERVEVLRGPQGTLFGRNTPAGVVKFDTRKPSNSPEAYARFNYGEFNFMSFEGAASGPIIDEVLSARVSLLFQRRDDWVDNLLTDADTDLEGFTQGAARFQLAFQPTDEFRVLLNAHGHSQEASARVFRANIIQPGTDEFTDDYRRSEVRQDGENDQNIDQFGFSSDISYDFGPVSFTGIYGFERASFFGRGDIDGGFGAAFAPLSGPGLIPFPSETADGIPQVDQHTVELRLATDDLNYFNAQVGMFYFNEDLRIESFSYDTFAGGALNGFARQRQETEAIGVFATVRVDPTPQLHLQGGLRWSDDQKDFVAQRTISPVGAGPTEELSTDTGASFLSWDASVTYDLFRDISVYGRVARGFRAPSIQGRILFGDTLSVADTESVLSFEAGTKTRFLNNRARVNVTGFYYEISDQQLTAVGGAANFNTLLNADQGVGYGVEVDAAFLPFSNLEISFGGSYNFTEIRDDDLAIAPCGSGCTVLDPAGAVEGTVVIDGNALPHAPEWIANVNATYTFDVADKGQIYFNTDWAYRSRVYFFLYESEEFTDPHLLEVGARIGFRTFGETTDVALYLRNAFNDNSRTGGIDFNNLTGFVNEPRVVGVEGTFQF